MLRVLLYLWTQNMTSPHADDYDHALLLEVLKRYPSPTLDRVYNGAYWRTIQDGESLALVKVPETWQPEIVAGQGNPNADHVHKSIRYILNMEQPPPIKTTLTAYQEQLQPVAGLPLLRTQTIFEALLMVIIEQHIAWRAAQRAQFVLCEWGGRYIDHDGQRFYAYPTIQQIAEADPDDLKILKITHRRIDYLIALAQQFLHNPPRITPDDSGYNNLLSLKGVGAWTATVVMARAFGIYETVPYADVAIQAAVNHYFLGKGGRASKATLETVFQPSGGGMAAQYLLMRWVLDMY